MSYFQPDTETLLAVVLGALLATVGGFSERQLERAVQRDVTPANPSSWR